MMPLIPPYEGTADDELREQLKIMREMGASPEAIDAKIAQNVLHEDLGYYSSKTTEYDLGQGTRDKLLAHARQDAAHAVYASHRATDEVRKLRPWLRVMTLLLLVLVVMVGYVIWA